MKHKFYFYVTEFLKTSSISKIKVLNVNIAHTATLLHVSIADTATVLQVIVFDTKAMLQVSVADRQAQTQVSVADKKSALQVRIADTKAMLKVSVAFFLANTAKTLLTGKLHYRLAQLSVTLQVRVAVSYTTGQRSCQLRYRLAQLSVTLQVSVADKQATLTSSVAFSIANTATKSLTGNLVSVSCTFLGSTNATLKFFFFSKSCSVSCKKLALTVALRQRSLIS